MSRIVNLADAAERRDQRREEMRAAHPSLRWVAGEVFYVAHRKHEGSAACGADGSLTLAPPGVPRCVECWPIEHRDPSALILAGPE